jgi:hypothetical protein
MDASPIATRRHTVTGTTARTAIPVLCALVLLMSGASADARRADPHFGPREARVAGGPWAALTGLADAYWAKRSLHAPCPATLWIYSDSDPNTAATAQMRGCEMGFNRTWLLWVRSAQRIADRYGRRARMGGTHPIIGRAAIQQHLLTELCLNVVHERGHNLGLRHTPDPRGVM